MLEARTAAGVLPVELGPPSAVAERPAGWEAPVLLGATFLLLAFGLVVVYSASAVRAQSLGLPDYHFVVRQAAGGAIGLVLLGAMARMDYRRLRLLAWPILGAACVLLLLIVVPWTLAIAPVINGARRWLFIGPAAMQPSELAKLAVVIWTAALAVKKQPLLHSLSRGLLPFLVVWSAVAGLIFLQPNLSAAVLLLLLGALVVFAAGARIGHFLVLAAVGVPLLWAQVEAVAYRLRRIVAFLDSGHDPAGMSYQINQSLIALGSGGLFGRGLGRGEQKFGFLPEAHNDFVFAMIGEEFGLLGIAGVLVAFVCIAVIGYRIARMAPDMFGLLLGVGVTNLIVVQALLHMAVTMALVPTTGLTLPLVSYGRSSLLVSLVAIGVLLSIARVAARPPEPVGWRRS